VAGSGFGRRALFAVGVALIVGALVSPLADWGENRSFAAHMAQHLLLGDLAPLALVLAVRPGLPRLTLLVALPAWAANLAVWHVPLVYEAALHHVAVHVVQHVALFVAGALLWTAVVSETLRIGTRLAIVVAMMLAGLVLASVLLWWSSVLYSTYAHARQLAGMSPLTDQRVGGGLMLLEGMVVALSAAAWLILQLFREPAATAPAGVSPSP
jgi:cytochrome c oxidase assembly factor CtaG